MYYGDITLLSIIFMYARQNLLQSNEMLQTMLNKPRLGPLDAAYVT